jgi:AhpD family alkylhydroperoxidase
MIATMTTSTTDGSGPTTDGSGLLVDILDASTAPLLARHLFADGDPGPIAATLAHVPELVAPVLPMLGAVLSPGGLDVRTKEIAIVRTSAVLSCRYCIDSHTGVALDAGLSHAEVQALRRELDVDEAFPADRDRVVIEWIDAVAGGRGPIDAQLRSRVASQLTQAAIVELTLLVGTTMLLNRYATALGLPVGATTSARLVAEGFAADAAARDTAHHDSDDDGAMQ